MVEKMVFLMVD
jgi:hypothetical protein